MTQVDFYVLAADSRLDRFQLACRVADKARLAGHRVVIHTSDNEEARHLDRLLWTFQEQSFVPHGLIGESEPEITPILIGDAVKADDEQDVLINLELEVPALFSRFKRLAECVDNETAARNASRERYRFYRDRGYPLNLHEIA